MKQNAESILRYVSLYIFYGLLAYMPLHILLSTWIGTSFGILDFVKIAKDILLVIGFLAVLGASIRRRWFGKLLQDKLVWLIVAFCGLNFILSLLKPTDQAAEILGIVYNTRFLMFFVYGWLLTYQFPVKDIKWTSLKAVLTSGALVVLFGVAQYFVIPNNALEHLGYQRVNGVLPAFFIDEKPDLERVMSTIRDPNSLGSYLVIVTLLVLAMVLVVRRRKTKIFAASYMALALLCLWLTFSRSALLGLIVALTVFTSLYDSRLKVELMKRHRLMVGIGTILIIVLAGSFLELRKTYWVQNVIFHADQSTVLEDPNQLRVRFWRESVQKIRQHPEGQGPGTAGLASIRNKKQGVMLNENYYLQIATETGIIGLLLFLSILVVVAWRFFVLRSDVVAVALLASFAGLALTNFLVHIWANEAVAYTWWGLAGTYMMGRNSHNKTPKE
jgi:O-antigen ligase